MVVEPDLQELLSRFLASVEPAQKALYQGELNRFLRWFGRERKASDLRAHDVAAYSEELLQSDPGAVERLQRLREFLSFLKKEKLTPVSLAPHVRLRRVQPKVGGVAERAVEKVVHVSKEGHARLEEELRSLLAQRPGVAEELRRARADKDFRENAPLDAAREAQAHLEARIREVEAALRNARLIESNALASNRVAIGSTVVVRNLGFDEEERYTLVGPREANPSSGKISHQSPIGQALLERLAGEEIEVEVPAGRLRYRIEKIEQPGS